MKILIVGAIERELISAIEIAKKKGAKVYNLHSLDEALHTLRSDQSFDVVFLDVRLDISKFIKQLSSEKISIEVAAYGINISADTAASAIKAGAIEYLPLPPDERVITAILEKISKDITSEIGISESWVKIKNIIEKIAPSEATVLITGESGTGKEVAAKLIHSLSKRAEKEIISINCAAIPESLLESELFGHEKGAFTGATDRRIGKFEAANKSTLFLDEISEMDYKVQAKLLRAIQERKITRIGGNQEVSVDVRIIASSNRDLPKCVVDGEFREDLFFRLNVINIELPPLRERVGDISELTKFFIIKYAKLNDINVKQISNCALEKLEQYYWPGNIRELENTIHRALLISSEIIEEKDIMLNEALIGKKCIMKLSEIEKNAISDAIKSCKGDQTKAALALGISIKVLREKLQNLEKAA